MSRRSHRLRLLAGLLTWSAVLFASPVAGTNEEPAGVRVLRTGGLDLEQAALLLSGQEGGPLPLAVFAAPIAAAAGGADTLVVVEVDGAALLAPPAAPPVAPPAAQPVAPPAERLYLDLCIYVLSGSGPAVAASVLETVEVDLAAHRERIASAGIRLVRHVVLPAGDHSLRVLVRNRTTRDLGLRVRPLAVPSFAAGTPLLAGPFFAGHSAAWLDVGNDGAAAPSWLPAPPAALPVMSVTAPTHFDVVGSAGAAGPFEVQLEHGGKPVATVAAVVHARRPLADGLEVVTLSVELPPLPAAVAELRVRSGGATLAPLRVVHVEAGAAPAVWTAVLAGARAAQSGVRAPAGSPPPPPPPQRHGRRQWSTTYRRALQQLTGEPPEAGTAAVVAFEQGVLAAEGGNAQPLAELELEVLGELAAKDAEALWPVMALYLQTHREHLAARATLTATHAQRMILALADLYAKSAAAPSRRMATVPLLALVADLPLGRERFLRTRALEAARGYDAQNAGVLLCAAVGAEAYGDHEQAVQALAQLRRVDAGNVEAQLRLGVIHARTGAERAARAALRAAIAGAPRSGESTNGAPRSGESTNGADPAAATPWWLPLAYQELGRLQLEAGDLADAERLLRQGLARLPREEKLSLLLASVLGKRGDREGAQAVLDEMAPSPVDRGFDSARVRYMQLPTEPLLRAREELLRLAAAARPRLAAALVGTGGEVSR